MKKKVLIKALVTAEAWVDEYPNGEIKLDVIENIKTIDECEILESHQVRGG